MTQHATSGVGATAASAIRTRATVEEVTVVASPADVQGSPAIANVQSCPAEVRSFPGDAQILSVDQQQSSASRANAGQVTSAHIVELGHPINTPPPPTATPPTELEVRRIDDYTKLPLVLDKCFEELRVDGAVRASVLTVGETWTKTSSGYLRDRSVSTLNAEEQSSERAKALDLLDVLTRSGALAVDHVSMHVLYSFCHCFDKSVLSTVVEDNVNPIEQVERAILILCSTLHGVAIDRIVQPQETTVDCNHR